MQEEEEKIHSDANMEHFRDVWFEFDPDGTYFINVEDLISLLSNLQEPFGYDRAETLNMKIKLSYLKRLKLPTYKESTKFYYYDVI